jgi:hypothetical protein
LQHLELPSLLLSVEGLAGLGVCGVDAFLSQLPTQRMKQIGESRLIAQFSFIPVKGHTSTLSPSSLCPRAHL